MPLLAGAKSHPVVTWDLERDALELNGRAIEPRAVFIRHDVFTALADGRDAPAQRAYAWFTTLLSWAAAHPEVRLLNRDHTAFVLKPQQLLVARTHGLHIPSTLVTNDSALLKGRNAKTLVVKPVAGGDYCQPLAPVLQSAPRRGSALAAPAIVQARLVPPELRIYRVGEKLLSFRVESEALDYRTDAKARVVPVPTDRALAGPLRAAMDALDLDFGAADFKRCPDTGRMLFLEVNSSPMFAAFDAASDGAVSRALTRALLRPR